MASLRPAVATSAIARQALGARFFSAASANVQKELGEELKHEKSNYEQPDIIKKYLSSSEWKFEEKSGDVNMTLTKETGSHKLIVDFQLLSPVNDAMEEPEAENEEPPMDQSTDFSITVEKKDGSGVMLYCSTTSDFGQEENAARFVIGNMRTFNTAEEKESMSSYNGPEFEDLDEKLQESIDEWLSSLGFNAEVCDFIDTMALDKEQREYVGWLSNLNKIVS